MFWFQDVLATSSVLATLLAIRPECWTKFWLKCWNWWILASDGQIRHLVHNDELCAHLQSKILEMNNRLK